MGTTLPSAVNGSYVREALQNGLALEAQGIKNPFQFGLVAASDTHVAASSDDESTFFSKVGLLDGTPVGRGSVPVSLLYGAVIRLVDPEYLVEVEGRDLERLRHRRRLGGGEHPRVNLRRVSAQGNLRHLRSAHPGALLCQHWIFP